MGQLQKIDHIVVLMLENRSFDSLFGKLYPKSNAFEGLAGTLGEQLIADVYNCLRASKSWRKTLLIITYDEHGGCYDHVAPPAAVAPEPPLPEQIFAFDRYGVRVPAVVLSPYVAPGTIFRQTSRALYDHTSIIATVRKRFGLSSALTARDAAAPDLDGLLSLPKPTNLGPLRVKALPYAPSPTTAAVAQTKPLNSMQKALVGLAANPPPAPGSNLQNHLAKLRVAGPQAAPAAALASVHDARDYVKRQAGSYFQSH
jgi:phospholipase C